MSQKDFNISTADANTGASFRVEVNENLQALASNSSGATAPTTTYPFQVWADTTANPAVIKMRDADNADWVTIGTVDSTGNAFLAANTDKLDGLSSADFATAAQGAAADAALPIADSIGRNRLINGDYRINQRGVTSAADDAYIYDRFYVLTESGNVGISGVANAESGTPTMLRLTQPDVSAKRLGVAQIIESSNCIDLRGKSVTFRLNRFRCSSSQAIRWAILEWTGTADTVTSDVVNDWASATYTAGNFFLASNLTIAGTGSMTPSSNTLTTGNKLTATISASANNLIVMVWTEGTLAQNGTLDLAKLQLEEGGNATVFEHRLLQFETSLCYGYGEWISGVLQATNIYNTFYYKAKKRRTPTIGTLSFETGTGGTVAGAPIAALATSDTPAGVLGLYQNTNHTVTASFSCFVDAEL